MPIMSHEDSVKVIDGVNNVIKNSGVDTNKISDGYHTFGELYEHRIILFIVLCKVIDKDPQYQNSDYAVWKTLKHSDGSEWDGWFILGVGHNAGEQITYHLPISKWEECKFATELEQAPEWDGHTSNDVLERLKSL